jgi:hypothetical protein
MFNIFSWINKIKHKVMTQNTFEMKTLPGHDMAGSLQEGKDSKLDLPFDLNNLFSLQYSFDTLKVAIEYLAR